MFRSGKMTFNHIITLLLATAAGFVILFIVRFPDQAFQASLQGLKIWWSIVFPALLPFLILSEMFIAFGMAHAFGALLEPAMRLFFRLPGTAGWAVVVGWTAGYPTGAEAAAKLRKQKQISRCEGERLLGLSHAANPIWLISVVATGFLGEPQFGLFLIAVQILSIMATGLTLRFYRHTNEPEERIQTYLLIHETNRAARIRFFSAMRHARDADGRAFGKILGDAVTSSIQILLMIGGFMMIFSVLLKVIDMSKLSEILNRLIQITLIPLGYPRELIPPLISGLFEVNLGAYEVGRQFDASPVWTAALVSGIAAWGGLSIHAQVKSSVQQTDLRYGYFLWSRLVHVGYALILPFWLWNPLQPLMNSIRPAAQVFAHNGTNTGYSFFAIGSHLWTAWLTLGMVMILWLLVFTGLSLLALPFYNRGRP
ncbi:nucleoside recognition domain-containing protein [Ferviditalea candida]|uniref:Nucleoside recognition domain-containing protein n=1 Tax=Ferviditalea candida TaxID=3108399 RepID=A0ABU5ZIR1_9BACL|nr:nucleoside recognition domain-containing protein [Paenibacillaceae bacterium T2]